MSAMLLAYLEATLTRLLGREVRRFLRRLSWGRILTLAVGITIGWLLVLYLTRFGGPLAWSSYPRLLPSSWGQHLLGSWWR